MKNALTKFDFRDIQQLKTGKVRNIFDMGENQYLIVASDRISAFDVVLPNGIPDKGIILTQISNFWFRKFKDIIKNHLLYLDYGDYPDCIPEYIPQLRKRSVVVKAAKVIPYECIVRGYISGSLWKQYTRNQMPEGLELPRNLLESQKLPEPIFTPTTKAESGHDEPVTEDIMIQNIGSDLVQFIKNKSLEIFKAGQHYCENVGIILADTKFEFGLIDDEPILIDEVLTPDSSRFWPMDEYQPGGSQKSFDKQYVRDYLLGLTWDKTPPGPDLTEDVILATRSKYLEVFKRIVGHDAPVN